MGRVRERELEREREESKSAGLCQRRPKRPGNSDGARSLFVGQTQPAD